MLIENVEEAEKIIHKNNKDAFSYKKNNAYPGFQNISYERWLAKAIVEAIQVDEERLWLIICTEWDIDKGNNRDERFKHIAKSIAKDILTSDILKVERNDK